MLLFDEMTCEQAGELLAGYVKSASVAQSAAEVMGGAGLGAGLGALSELMQRKKKKDYLRKILLGGLAGGALGALPSALRVGQGISQPPETASSTLGSVPIESLSTALQEAASKGDTAKVHELKAEISNRGGEASSRFNLAAPVTDVLNLTPSGTGVAAGGAAAVGPALLRHAKAALPPSAASIQKVYGVNGTGGPNRTFANLIKEHSGSGVADPEAAGRRFADARTSGKNFYASDVKPRTVMERLRPQPMRFSRYNNAHEDIMHRASNVTQGINKEQAMLKTRDMFKPKGLLGLAARGIGGYMLGSYADEYNRNSLINTPPEPSATPKTEPVK